MCAYCSSGHSDYMHWCDGYLHLASIGQCLLHKLGLVLNTGAVLFRSLPTYCTLRIAVVQSALMIHCVCVSTVSVYCKCLIVSVYCVYCK